MKLIQLRSRNPQNQIALSVWVNIDAISFFSPNGTPGSSDTRIDFMDGRNIIVDENTATVLKKIEAAQKE